MAEEQSAGIVESSTVPPVVPATTDGTIQAEQPQSLSLVQSLLLAQPEEPEGKGKKKKKKKGKTGRQKELERLTKATKAIFASPEQLNVVCKRIDTTLSNRKALLLEVCRSLDMLETGRLPYEQFRLVIKDRLPTMTREDFFVMSKLFEIEDVIDYRTLLDESLGNGILRHITQLSVPPSKEIVLEKKLPKQPSRPFNEPFQPAQPKYISIQLRLITFDSYNAYPGHIRLTVPDHISVYTLSKMVIDETDLATRSVSIFREKVRSRHALLDPMRSLEQCRLTGAYLDGTYKQQLPTYTLYYDYSPLDTRSDCPILKCDYFMN